MLDLEIIRRDPTRVRENLERRGNPEWLKLLAEVQRLDGEWLAAHRAGDDVRRRRNETGERLSAAKKKGEPVDAFLAEAKALNDEQAKVEATEAALEEPRRRALMRLPNLMDPAVPFGKDDHDNAVHSTWGEARPLGFEGRSHSEVAERLGVADFERGRRSSGAGFNYLKGPLAQLDLALQRFALDLVTKRGFTLVIPPYMLRRAPYEGVTDLGDFENVMYKIEGDDLYLIATSEHPLAALYMGEILEEESLPLRLVGVSPCFRREIGGHGVDQKGTFRMHQFHKVEQFVFCRPEDSPKIHEELRENAEEVFRQLQIPYRVVLNCTGDLGTVAAKKYDVEAYFSKQGAYREVVSCSNCTDYQARRLGIRQGKRGKPGKAVPHTLNSTAVATSRAMAAILENFQQPDGSVTIPEVLRPYLGGMDRITPIQVGPK